VFNKEIYDLTLTSDIANDIFPNICGESYNGDNTFLATLRALLAPRMKEEDFVNLRVKVRSDRESTVKGMDDASFVSEVAYGVGNNTILICGLNGTEGAISASMQKIGNAFLKSYTGFEELKDLRVFTQKQADIRFYINEEIRATAIFVGAMNTRIWHFIQSLTSRLVPWYFAENPLNDEERALVTSLTQKYAPSYEQIIKTFADKYDFRSKKIQKLLGGFETAAKRQQLRNVENNLQDKENRIDRNVSQYMDLIREREQLLVQKAGLTQMINEGCTESEIADYFVCNRHLNPLSINNTRLDFIVDCYLENFDPDMYERISENFRGYMYTEYDVSCSTFAPNEARKKLLDAIFSDEPLLKVKMCAFYSIDLQGSVSSVQNYSYPTEYRDCIPNPHLQRHNCLGNHKRYIEECLRNGNNIGAIEQCVSSAKSINVGESATFPSFLKALFSSSCKSVIELPDGTSCTPKEAYEWLLAQESTPEVEESNGQVETVVVENPTVEEPVVGVVEEAVQEAVEEDGEDDLW